MLLKRVLKTVKNINDWIDIPFYKKILVSPDFNWFQFNHLYISLLAFLKRHQLIFLKNPPHVNHQSIPFIGKLSVQSTYKGVNLFAVTRYNICVDLRVYEKHIDFSDEVHCQVIAKWYSEAIAYIDYILPFFEKKSIYRVIILQGYLYTQAILRWFCIQHDIQVIAFENTFYKNKMIWDFVSGISVNKNLSANFFWKYDSLIGMEKAKRYAENFINNIKDNKQTEHQSPKVAVLPKLPKEKTIFFVGQVYTDASTLFGIYDFDSPLPIIETLVNYSVKHNINLIIKLHPKEISGKDICKKPYNSLTHHIISGKRNLFKQISNSPNILYDYDNKYDTYAMIKASDLCVTINSQTGLEASLMNKCVITCGTAFYDCINSVFIAKNTKILTSIIDNLLTKSPTLVDMEQIYRFFYIFCEKYCIEKNEKSFVNKITHRLMI